VNPVSDDHAPPQLPPAPINVHSTSLAVLALLAVIAFLYLAQAVFIPVTIAILASYALSPVVGWLRQRLGFPKSLGAGLLLTLMLACLGFGIGSLQVQAIKVLDVVPRATAKLGAALRHHALEPPGALERFRKAAGEFERVADAATATTSLRTPAGTTIKTVEDGPVFRVRNYLAMGTAGLLAGMGQLVVVVSLVYFLLIAGDSFRRTLLRIGGGTLSAKKITLQILDEIDSQIQRYLLVQLAMSMLLGVVTWVALAWIGLDNALFWACVGGVLHFIPYVGPAAFVLIATLMAYVQFDRFQSVILVFGSTLTMVGVVGLLLMPWLTQRAGRLNAVTVLVTLLFWGWLWGVWGLLLGVPIVMAINAVCERVESLRPIAEFMGYARKQLQHGAVGHSADDGSA
jgi:predicted PurR-regulated permease PerM